MDRRDVLKLGVGAVAVGGAGCATVPLAQGGLGDGGMAGFFAQLDGVMDRLATEPVLERFFAGSKKPVTQAPQFERGQDLARKTLRSLALVGALRELPEDQLAHPGVQQRLGAAMGEFDEALFGMTDVLEGLSSTDRADVAKALRDDPDLGMRLMGALDGEAAAWGVSGAGRLKLRGLAAQTTARLKQSPDLFITEYVGKMHKLAARHGAHEAAQRELATSLGEAMLWQGENPPEEPAAGGATQLSPPPPPPPEGAAPLAEAPAAPPRSNAEALADRRRRGGKKAGTVMLTAGGISLGVALTLVGLGFAVGSTGGALLFTLGAIVGIAGLIVLLIGLIIFLANL